MAFPNMSFGSGPQHLVNDAVQGAPLGQRMFFADGRRFSYGLCGATTLISGDIIQGKALVSGDYTDKVSDVAPAIGDTSISITTTTTTAAAYYDGGWMHCNLATTLLQGQSYRLKASGANVLLTSGAADIFQLDPADPIRVAGTTASEFGFVPNEYNGMIVGPVNTLTSRVVGVAQAPITNAKYGYVQTWGMSCVQAAASNVVGNYVSAILATEAGRSGVAATDIDQEVGIILSVATTAGQEGSVFLMIE